MNASMLNEKIIGKTVKEAKKLCADNQIRCRIASKDGKEKMFSCDYQPNRVNFAVSKGIVTDSHLG
jgi:NifU-like protein involved in Fe-S cluster formation